MDYPTIEDAIGGTPLVRLQRLGAQEHTGRGNIRELRNVLEQAAMSSDSERIDAAQLEKILRDSGLARIAPAVAPPAPPDATAPDALLRPLGVQVAELERRAIAAALAATGDNKLATARMLGISRATLYQRLENPDQ